jgi:hypothetical protein
MRLAARGRYSPERGRIRRTRPIDPDGAMVAPRRREVQATVDIEHSLVAALYFVKWL